jgi:hypothetical protein
MPAVVPSALRIILAPAAMLLLAAAWCAYWFLLLGTMQNEYRKAVAGLHGSGTSLTCAQAEWGGFPFRITLTCREPKLQMTRPAELDISARTLTIMMQAYDRTHFIALLDGPTTATGADRPPLVMTHERITASLVAPKHESVRFAADIPEPALENLGRARHVLVNAIMPAAEPSRLWAQATDIGIAATRQAALDEVGLELSGPLEQILGAITAPSPQHPAPRIDVNRLEARQGPLQLKGQGHLSLDVEGQPEGEILTSINDIDALVGKMREVAGLQEAELQAMKQLIVLLAGKSGERPIPLIIRKGIVYWGPFAILNLPGSG